MFTRLAERVSRKVRERVLAVSRAQRWRRVPAGFSMIIDPKEFHDRAFYLGVYEPEVAALIGAVVSPGDTCIDIGAQKGYFSLQMAKRVGPTGAVHSFEPDPSAQKFLEEHIRRNNYTNTHLHPYLLADEDGTRQFVLSSVVGWSSCFPNDLARKYAGKTVSVEARALDGININTSRLSFIKLDVEGAEPIAIRGMLNTLRSSDACLCMEINPGSLQAAGFSVDDLEELLLSAGYSFAAIECDRNFALHVTPLNGVRSWMERAGFGYVNVAAMRSKQLARMIEPEEHIRSHQ